MDNKRKLPTKLEFVDQLKWGWSTFTIAILVVSECLGYIAFHNLDKKNYTEGLIFLVITTPFLLMWATKPSEKAFIKSMLARHKNKYIE